MTATLSMGVIGVGNMGSALVRGIVRAGVLPPAEIVVADAIADRAPALARELGVEAAGSGAEVAARSRYVVLAVKPGAVDPLLSELAPVLTPDHTVISIAAGVTISRMRRALGEAGPALVRVMPNTPALVGAGMFAVTAPEVPAERVEFLRRVFSPLGRVVEVEERMMDGVTALSGSGPAFVFVMIQALADGGVAAGLPPAVASELAAQTVLGAAKLVQETGEQPEALKEAVASRGGTTVAGLSVLERADFRGTIVAAVRAAAARSAELSQG